MNYLDFEVGNKNYKLRLTTRSVIGLERKLGGNPLKIFTDCQKDGSIPTITNMVFVLHAALQAFNANITLEEAYDIFDGWLAEGHIASDFANVIIDLYKDAGLIQKSEESEKN